MAPLQKTSSATLGTVDAGARIPTDMAGHLGPAPARRPAGG